MKDTTIEYSGLTDGILVSVESTCHVIGIGPWTRYVLKFKGKTVHDGAKVKEFAKESGAKAWANEVVKRMFWHGEYWHSQRHQFSKWHQVNIDFSATVKMVKVYGELASRFHDPKTKAIFKKIAKELFDKGYFTVEKIEI